MNILTFNYEYPPVGGGGGVVHALTAEELARRHRVCVITSGFKGLPSHETRGGVEIFRVPVVGRNDLSFASLASMLSFPPSAWVRTAALMRRERFDIINCHFAVPTGPGALPAAKLARIPLVLSLHGGDIYDPSKRLSPHRLAPVRWMVRRMLRGADVVVAQSTNTRDNARKYYGFRGAIELIPLGIRQPTVPGATRDALGLPRDVFLGVTIGRLVKRKALDVLLRALARPECEGVHLAVIGAGPELNPLQRLARDLEMGDRVLFLGWVDETRKWQMLKAANAYVSSTMHEGFGLVYLEAMASGLPVITPDCGGQLDFLRDGETGFLVPAGNPVALAAAIARLRAEPALAARMATANVREAPKYRIEACAAAYEALFTRLVAER